MRKSLFQLALMLFCGSWCTEALALWTRVDEPITTASGLRPGMKIVLTNVCAEMATTKYLFTPDMRYAVHNDKVMKENVIALESAGPNPYNGEPMYYLKSELEGLYFNGSNGFTANQENALPITFGSAQKTTVLEKGEGWTPDNPVWPTEGKIPAWDWKNGDALTVLHYSSATEAEYLFHIWGWDNYTKAQWQGTINPLDNTVGTFTAVNPWYAYEVVYEESPVDDLNDLLTKHQDAGYENIYMGGVGVGYCDTAAVAAYSEALAIANDLLMDAASTDEQLKAAAANIETTFEAMKASLSMPRDGAYYYVLSSFGTFETQQKEKKAWYKDESAVRWKTFDRDDIAFLFKFTKQEDGTFAIQSLKDNTYLSGWQSVSATPSTTQSFWPTGGGAFYIVNGAKATSGGIDVYHARDHGNGAGKSGALTNWYAASSAESASSWRLEEFTDLDKIDDMLAVEAQRKLTAAFNSALSEARADSAAGYVTAIHNYWCPVKLFDKFSPYKFTGQLRSQTRSTKIT